MSRKRRQRSTTIRKRIEKKQREEQKARRKQQKAAGGGQLDIQVRVVISRAAAKDSAAALLDLGRRLAVEPIRGWTPHDLAGDHGLAWLAEQFQASLNEQPGDPLEVDIVEGAKAAALDKLGGLEIAAPGLGLDWEAGFAELFQAVARAEELPEPEEDEDDPEASGEDDDASEDEDASG